MQGIVSLEVAARVLEGGKISATIGIVNVVVEEWRVREVRRMRQERVGLIKLFTIGFLHHNAGD